MIPAIFGYGGHAQEVSIQTGIDTFFIDDKYYSLDMPANVLPSSYFDHKKYELIVAVSNPLDRKKIISSLPLDTKYITFIHPTSFIGKHIRFDEGCFIGMNSIITTNVILGKHSLLNRGNQIGHDCRLGDYFTMMPGSIVSGNVNAGNLVYMGTNSVIIEKTNICSNVTIGALGCVIKDINEMGTYVGVPVKKNN